MMILTRRLTKHTVIPGLVAGLAWGLSGCTTSEVTAGLRLVAGAYLPWCALGILGLSRTIRETPSLRAVAGATARAAIPFGLCFLTGEVFIPLLAGAFALSVAVGDILAIWAPAGAFKLRTWVWRFGLGVCAAAVLATGLASAVLWPLKHTMAATARTAPLSRDIAEVGSFHPWRLAEMIAPGAMGDPYTAYPAGSWVGDPGLGDRPLLYGCYLGSSVLVLALLAFGRNRKLATALGALAVLALAGGLRETHRCARGGSRALSRRWPTCAVPRNTSGWWSPACRCYLAWARHGYSKARSARGRAVSWWSSRLSCWCL
jgi:hypothetical protein